MDNAGRIIAVTGAAGYVGSRLLQELEGEESLSKVIAIDLHSLPHPVHNIMALRMDVTHQLGDALHDLKVNGLVHLASNLDVGRNRRDEEDVTIANIKGVHSVLQACRSARVDNLIYLSSHTVYGPHRDNPVPITEEAHLRPMPEFRYSVDKALAEQAIQEFATQNPGVRVTILRSCTVLGPSADSHAASAFLKPVLFGIWGMDPSWQFVHEEDIARLLTLLVMEPHSGIYNVAGDGIVAYSHIARLARRRLLRLPSWLAQAVVQATWALNIQRESPSQVLDFSRYPIVLSTGKLKKEIDFRFK